MSLAEVRQGLDDVARLAQPTFGSFDARPLNWQPDGSRWSIAQCFEHLVIANRVMMGAAMDALDDARSRTIWQRLPVLPGILGRTLIRSQAPETARKFKASPKAQPAVSRPTSSSSSASGIATPLTGSVRSTMFAAQPATTLEPRKTDGI